MKKKSESGQKKNIRHVYTCIHIYKYTHTCIYIMYTYTDTDVELVGWNNGMNSKWNITFSTVRSFIAALPSHNS